MNECSTRQCTLFGCPFQMKTPQSIFTTVDGRNFSCEFVDHLKQLNNGINKEEANKNQEEIVEVKIACYVEIFLKNHIIVIDAWEKTVDGFHFQMPNTSLGPFFMTPLKVIQAQNCSNCARKPCHCFYHKRFAFGHIIQVRAIQCP